MQPKDFPREPVLRASAFKGAVHQAVRQVLELIALTQDIYSLPPKHSSAPIGKHIRHIVDHVWAYERGVIEGGIDYNLRHRDSELETEPALAKQALKNFLLWLDEEDLLDDGITVECEISTGSTVSPKVESSAYRELSFVISHTYHHLAYASLIARTMNVEVPTHIGIAPATATYLRDGAEQVCNSSSPKM